MYNVAFYKLDDEPNESSQVTLTELLDTGKRAWPGNTDTPSHFLVSLLKLSWMAELREPVSSEDIDLFLSWFLLGLVR